MSRWFSKLIPHGQQFQNFLLLSDEHGPGPHRHPWSIGGCCSQPCEQRQYSEVVRIGLVACGPTLRVGVFMYSWSAAVFVGHCLAGNTASNVAEHRDSPLSNAGKDQTTSSPSLFYVRCKKAFLRRLSICLYHGDEGFFWRR